MKYYFIIDYDSPERINWNNFNLPLDVNLVLITDEECFDLLKITNKKTTLDSVFKHIEVFNYYKYFADDTNKIFSYNNELFNELKSIILRIKNIYLKNENQFHILSISECTTLYCAKLREYFNISGSRTGDVLRFLNKDIMKNHLINEGISRTLIPKYIKFEPKIFSNNSENYINKIIQEISLPVFTKPLYGTGSLGINKLETKEELWKWCHVHYDDIDEYEIEEYIEGDLYHCASVVQNNKIVLSFVSKYLNPCGDAFLNEKVIGSIILEQQSTIALKIKSFNKLIIDALKPIENCVMHHEIFCRTNGDFIFLEITNRVINGGHVAELFYDQFRLNLREIDYKLRLSLDVELIPKDPTTYYALIASVSRKNYKIKNIFSPKVKSSFEFINKIIKEDINYDTSKYLDISYNDIEIKLWNKNFKELLEDFESLKDVKICSYYKID